MVEAWCARFLRNIHWVGLTRRLIGMGTPCRSASSPAIRYGEIIYNLRAALDYLVFELTLMDTGAVQKDTQFPTESSKKDGFKQQSRFLKGLNAEHQAAIEARIPMDSQDDQFRSWLIMAGRSDRCKIIDVHGGTSAQRHEGMLWPPRP